MSDIIIGITRFMSDDLGIDGHELKLDEPLFSSGIIDSFSLVSLLTFLENSHNIRVSPAEVNLDNFDSLQKMQKYVESKLTLN
jgi:acyl carrier protein